MIQFNDLEKHSGRNCLEMGIIMWICTVYNNYPVMNIFARSNIKRRKNLCTYTVWLYVAVYVVVPFISLKIYSKHSGQKNFKKGCQFNMLKSSDSSLWLTADLTQDKKAKTIVVKWSCQNHMLICRGLSLLHTVLIVI